jgi:lipopolysaccharide export system permease protein
MIVFGTLGRYFSLQFTKTTQMVFGTMFALIYVLDFVELMRRAGDVEGASAGLMARLALFRVTIHQRANSSFRCAVWQYGDPASIEPQARTCGRPCRRHFGLAIPQPGIVVAAVIGGLAVAVYNPTSAYLKQQASAIEARVFVKRNADAGRRSGSGKAVWMGRRFCGRNRR